MQSPREAETVFLKSSFKRSCKEFLSRPVQRAVLLSGQVAPEQACAVLSSDQMAPEQSCAVFSSTQKPPEQACAVLLNAEVTPEHAYTQCFLPDSKALI